MSTESKRTDYGMTLKGAVTVIEFTSNNDDGTPAPSVFQLRHGVRTVLETENGKAADAAAKAIVDA